MIQTNPPTQFLDGLLAATQPKSETFPVELAPGFVLEFRTLTDYSEVLKVRSKAQKFVENFPKIKHLEGWKDLGPIEAEALGLAFYMAETSSGGTRLTPFEFALISKKRANVFDAIKDAINAGQYAVVEQEEEEAVAEAKKESSGTSDGETA